MQNKPPSWKPPDIFVGREDILKALDNALLPTRATVSSWGIRSIALTGLPGIGKSAIASQFFYRRSAWFDYAIWLSANNGSHINTGFKVARKRCSFGHGAQVKYWLEELEDGKDWLEKPEVRKVWLVVIDGVADSSVLGSLRLRSPNGSILITRRPELFEEHPTRCPEHIDIPSLSNVEGALYLKELLRRKQSKNIRNPEEPLWEAIVRSDAFIEAVSSALCGLPQALRYFSEIDVAKLHSLHKSFSDDECENTRAFLLSSDVIHAVHGDLRRSWLLCDIKWTLDHLFEVINQFCSGRATTNEESIAELAWIDILGPTYFPNIEESFKTEKNELVRGGLIRARNEGFGDIWLVPRIVRDVFRSHWEETYIYFPAGGVY